MSNPPKSRFLRSLKIQKQRRLARERFNRKRKIQETQLRRRMREPGSLRDKRDAERRIEQEQIREMEEYQS